jgi:L-lactate utilization protein LutC
MSVCADLSTIKTELEEMKKQMTEMKSMMESMMKIAMPVLEKKKFELDEVIDEVVEIFKEKNKPALARPRGRPRLPDVLYA